MRGLSLTVESVAQWLEHRSTESEGLRFDSSWDSEMFSLSHARDKTKKHLSLFVELLLSRVSFPTFPTFCSKCLTSSNLISFLIKKNTTVTEDLQQKCSKFCKTQ